MPSNELSHYCQGPADLAEKIEKGFPRRLMVVSPRGLRRIVDVTYRVSLMKEEGRYPLFQILVPQSVEQVDHLLIRFEKPLLFESEMLHRLVPGVPQRPFALFVHEDEDGVLRAYGIGRAESSVLSFESSQEARWVQQRPWGLSLYATGPGQLMASMIIKEGGLPRSIFLSINAGVIRSINEFNSGWPEVGSGIHHRVSILWPKILTQAQSLGHGGMYVILPPRTVIDDVKDVIKVGHRTSEPDLGAIFDELLEERTLDAEQRLCDAVRTIVQLSAVDGCVVLTSTMQLQGFAAEVHIRDDEHLPEAIMIKLNPLRQSEIVQVNLKRYGTRHRSAARACSKLGARVFVVSQDGVIRAFERLFNGKVSIRGPFACGPGLSPDPLSGTSISPDAEPLEHQQPSVIWKPELEPTRAIWKPRATES